MPEVWDVVRVVASPAQPVIDVKIAALNALFPEAAPAEMVVKLRGWEILDETASLADSGVVDGSILADDVSAEAAGSLGPAVTIALISSSDCGRHDTGWGHPEHPGRLRAIPRALRDDPELFGRITHVEVAPRVGRRVGDRA